jgi:hypothetical protein
MFPYCHELVAIALIKQRQAEIRELSERRQQARALRAAQARRPHRLAALLRHLGRRTASDERSSGALEHAGPQAHMM